MATKQTSVKASVNGVNYEDNKVYEIPIREINRSSGTQPRVSINEEYVRDLAGLIESGVVLPPPVVFWDATLKQLILGDGFHRIPAHLLAGRSTVKCLVRLGDKRSAFFYGCGANSKHGNPSSKADKKYLLGKLLKDPEWSSMSVRKFASLLGTDPKQIQRWKDYFNPRPGRKGKQDQDGATEGTSDYSRIEAAVQPPPSAAWAGTPQSDPFRRFTRSLEAEGIKFQSNVKTDLGMIRIVTKNAIYDVVSMLTPGTFGQAFCNLTLQGSRHYKKHQKVIVGHVTEELAEMVKEAKLHGVLVKNLD